jgi:diacylglycerol kinase (ATP)
MSRRALFIISPEAGNQTLEQWHRFETELKGIQLAYDQVLATRPGHPIELAHDMASGYDVVVAVGGDGTVYEVINGLMACPENRPALAILPFGTGNDSASAAGIHHPSDTFQALATGKMRSIDLIEIRCQTHGAPCVRYAMLFASVGITSDLLKHTTPRLKRLCGRRLAYIAGLLFALRTYAPGPMKVTCDGVTTQRRLIFACASNGETFGGGIRIAPGARLDDGKLNVNLIEAVGRLEALRHLQRLRQGRHTDHPKVCYKTALTLAVETDPPSEVAADGDLIGQTPAVFQVRPQAITLLTPQTGAPVQ